MNPSEKRVYMAAWWKRNPDKRRKYAQKRALKGISEERRAYKEAWRKANPERVRASAQKSAKKNAATRRTYKAAWEKANAERVRATARKSYYKKKAAGWKAPKEKLACIAAWVKANPEKRRAAARKYARKRIAEDPQAYHDKCRKWQKSNPEKVRMITRKHQLKKRHGLSPDEWEALFTNQGRRCAICRSQQSRVDGRAFHTDHCHKTNRARGILCHHCNLLLGNANDSAATLKAAIKYLENWKLKLDGGDGL